jgi:hypothetical protein
MATSVGNTLTPIDDPLGRFWRSATVRAIPVPDKSTIGRSQAVFLVLVTQRYSTS